MPFYDDFFETPRSVLEWGPVKPTAMNGNPSRFTDDMLHDDPQSFVDILVEGNVIPASRARFAMLMFKAAIEEDLKTCEQIRPRGKYSTVENFAIWLLVCGPTDLREGA